MRFWRVLINGVWAVVLVIMGACVAVVGPEFVRRQEARLNETAGVLAQDLAGRLSEERPHDMMSLQHAVDEWLETQKHLVQVELELEGEAACVRQAASAAAEPESVVAGATVELALARDEQLRGTVRLTLLRRTNVILDFLSHGYLSRSITAGVLALLVGWTAWRASRRSSGLGSAWRQARDRAAETLDALGEGVVVLDTRGKVMFANSAIHDTLGRTAGDLQGLHIDALGWESTEEQPSGPACALLPWRQAIADRHSVAKSKVWTRRRDGEKRTFKTTCRSIVCRRRLLGVLVTLDDVSVLEEQREQLRIARDAAERAAQTKSEFLANMSHEIRTPINGVTGTLELLAGTSLSNKQHDLVGAARGSAGALLRLINDILDFSKMEAGRLELAPIECSLEECLTGALRTVAPAAAGKGLELVLDCHEISELRVCVDPERLAQVIINLAANAVKFTAAGEVEVCARATIGSTAQVTISVRDTGIGIPADRRDRLFRSFSQVDASTSRKFGGTGLGLAISKQIVELMGGSIKVDSTLGQGSVFTIDLCLPVGAADGGARGAESDVPLPERVLIWDPNAVARRAIVEAVRACGGMVGEAMNADELVADARAAGASAMVLIGATEWTDVQQTLAERVRRSAPGVRVGAVTLRDVPASTEEATRDVVSAWFRKPMSPESIMRQLQRALDPQSGASSVAPKKVLRVDGEAAPIVLIVEDNPVGQMVTEGFVASLGLRSEVVGDGATAVKRACAQHYDVILMDCHLPEMDGFQAAAAIRQWERDTSRPPVPIVALTASAMSGDRQRCLEAGMSDYLTKPVGHSDLAAMLAKVMSMSLVEETPVSNHMKQEKIHEPVDEPFDITDLHARCLGRIDLMKDLLSLFDGAARDDLTRLEQAVAALDPQGVREAAHSLAGGALQVGAKRLAELARVVEAAGKAGILDEVAQQVQALQSELTRCRERAPMLHEDAAQDAQIAKAA